MNDLEKIIIEEISTLDEMRLIEIIGFIRYLKEEKPIKQKWIEGWYESALQSIHEKSELPDVSSSLKDPVKKKHRQ